MSTTKVIILGKRLPSKSLLNSSNNTSAVHGPPDGSVRALNYKKEREGCTRMKMKEKQKKSSQQSKVY